MNVRDPYLWVCGKPKILTQFIFCFLILRALTVDHSCIVVVFNTLALIGIWYLRAKLICHFDFSGT